MIKQGLQLKMGQQLAMTPQLQQAIKLLQLSTLDLQQEIQNVLDENPLLQQDDESGIAEVSSEQKDSSDMDTSEALTQQDSPMICLLKIAGKSHSLHHQQRQSPLAQSIMKVKILSIKANLQIHYKTT